MFPNNTVETKKIREFYLCYKFTRLYYVKYTRIVLQICLSYYWKNKIYLHSVILCNLIFDKIIRYGIITYLLIKSNHVISKNKPTDLFFEVFIFFLIYNA